MQIASIGFVVVEFCDASQQTSVFASIARWMGRGTTLQRGNCCVVYCWHIQIKHRWILAESIVSFQRKCFLAFVLRDAQTFLCLFFVVYIYLKQISNKLSLCDSKNNISLLLFAVLYSRKWIHFSIKLNRQFLEIKIVTVLENMI